MKFVIGSGEELTLDNLAEFPFVRCGGIYLDYSVGSHLIANKCEIFASQLQKFPALKKANSICVSANINQKRRDHFIDHTQFLEHLRNKLLPIFCYHRRFKFRIGIGSNTDAFTNIVSSILEIKQVNQSSNVGIHFVRRITMTNQYERLPIEAIANWLHRSETQIMMGKNLPIKTIKEVYLKSKPEMLFQMIWRC